MCYDIDVFYFFIYFFLDTCLGHLVDGVGECYRVLSWDQLT